MAPTIEGQQPTGADVSTRKSNACQAGTTTPATEHTKKHGKGELGYLSFSHKEDRAVMQAGPAGGDATVRAAKRSKFNIDAAAKRPKAAAVPRAAAITPMPSGTRLLPPSPDLDKMLGSPTVVIAIDIETHDWQDDEKACTRKGRFGWFALKEECVMEYARIVEIAWLIAAANPSSPPAPPRSELVQPIDFTISAKATKKSHHITNEEAHAKGVPLAAALSEFMKDVTDAVSKGGRLVSHHLDFVPPTCICTSSPHLPHTYPIIGFLGP